MLASFKSKTHRVGFAGHIQIGAIVTKTRKDGSTYDMGDSIGAFRVTTMRKADNDGFVDDAAVMSQIADAVRDGALPKGDHEGMTTRLPVWIAYDTPDASSVVDRSLFIGSHRACHSDDERRAEWRPLFRKDRRTDNVICDWSTPPKGIIDNGPAEDMGTHGCVTCAGPACPLARHGVSGPNATGRHGHYRCAERYAFLFRLRLPGAGFGVYDFETTSEITASSIYATMRELHATFGPNLTAIPVVLNMSQHGTSHGSTVWRVSLQIDCSRDEAIGHALAWQERKAQLRVAAAPESVVPVRPERPVTDRAYTALYHVGGPSDRDTPETTDEDRDGEASGVAEGQASLWEGGDEAPAPEPSAPDAERTAEPDPVAAWVASLEAEHGVPRWAWDAFAESEGVDLAAKTPRERSRLADALAPNARGPARARLIAAAIEARDEDAAEFETPRERIRRKADEYRAAGLDPDLVRQIMREVTAELRETGDTDSSIVIATCMERWESALHNTKSTEEIAA